eukprot:5685513-Amphidinium_carterae.3
MTPQHRKDVHGNKCADELARFGALEHVRGRERTLNHSEACLAMHIRAMQYALGLQCMMWQGGIEDHGPPKQARGSPTPPSRDARMAEVFGRAGCHTCSSPPAANLEAQAIDKRAEVGVRHEVQEYIVWKGGIEHGELHACSTCGVYATGRPKLLKSTCQGRYGQHNRKGLRQQCNRLIKGMHPAGNALRVTVRA